MKLHRIFIGAAMAALFIMSGCKPSESAYREAYSSAVAARASAHGADSDATYTPVIPYLKNTRMVAGADTVDVSHVAVMVIKDGGGLRESLKPYSVVVGQFKQVFNARQMRERIADRGYPGAFVLCDGEPRYFVIATSVPTLDEARDAMQKIKTDTANFRFHQPVPFILSRRSL